MPSPTSQWHLSSESFQKITAENCRLKNKFLQWSRALKSERHQVWKAFLWPLMVHSFFIFRFFLLQRAAVRAQVQLLKGVKPGVHVIPSRHRVQFSTGMRLEPVAPRFSWLTLLIWARMVHSYRLPSAHKQESSRNPLPTLEEGSGSQNLCNQANQCGVPFFPHFCSPVMQQLDGTVQPPLSVLISYWITCWHMRLNSGAL